MDFHETIIRYFTNTTNPICHRECSHQQQSYEDQSPTDFMQVITEQNENPSITKNGKEKEIRLDPYSNKKQLLMGIDINQKERLLITKNPEKNPSIPIRYPLYKQETSSLR